MSSWPHVWDELVAELCVGRGQPALVETSEGSARLLGTLGDRVAETISVGQLLVQADTPESVLSTARPVGDSALLVDIDVLFAPQLKLDVVAYLRQLSQWCALIVAWPGEITHGRLSYSRPGRADFLSVPATGLVVLRPVEAEFPDDTPYSLERYPA